MSGAAESERRRVAVIGMGTVGASWAALFAAYGHDVVAFDPAPASRQHALGLVDRARRQLSMLGKQGAGTICFEGTLAEAVKDADWVQENVIEDVAIKTDVLAAIDAAAPKRAVVGSSTSSLLHSAITAKSPGSARIVIAHPFNPPHLIPLVEIFGAPEAAATALSFYASLGRHPIVMRREQQGHIANRLTSALYREAVSLVASGAASVAEVDDALRFGPGLRWAVMGAHMLYHVGGGQGGIRHYLDQLGPSQERRWADLGTPALSAAVQALIAEGIDEAAGGRDITTLEQERDDALIAILTTLGAR